MKSDDVFKNYSRKKVQLTIRLLKENEYRFETVLIQGNAIGLSMLGELILAIATDPNENRRWLGPRTSGSAYFSKSATHDIYIERVDSKPKKKLAVTSKSRR